MLDDLLMYSRSYFDSSFQTDLRAQENRFRTIVLVNGNIMMNNRSQVSGINAKVYKNGISGFSSSSIYNEESIKTVIKAATENALFMEQHVKKESIPLGPMQKGVVPLNLEICDTTQKQILDTCREIDQYIEEKYPNLISRTIRYSEDSMEKILTTSEGYDGHTTSPRCYLSITFTTKTMDGRPIDLYKSIGGYGAFSKYFSNLEPIYEKIDVLYEELMKKREGVYAQAGYKTVILGGMMSGMLAHEAVGHTVEADLVQGGSVAQSALHKMVASPMVSLVDFAYKAFGKEAPLPVYLDDEGIAAEDVTLIRNGELVGYMNNRESAAQFQMRPRGNARAWMFSDEPLIRMRNTAILPGKDKLEDMISSIEDGYYLMSSNNGQADLTGEFMFGVTQGYEIKQGKLARALLDTTVSGIAFDMLKTVDMISDEVTWTSSGFCGKKQMIPVGIGGPAVRCKIMIGGR